MPLYVGYPISFETACVFFNEGKEHLGELLSRIEETGLQFVYIDKSQYILGLEVNIGNLFDNFVNVDDSVIRILEVKKKVIELIKTANIDMSNFMLQPIGEEATQQVSNPEPYLMTAAA